MSQHAGSKQDGAASRASFPQPSAASAPAPTLQHQSFHQQIKATLKQAWPVLVSSWASIVFGVMDTAMSGHAGAVDLQVMGLSIAIYLTVFIGLMGVIHALIPIIAQHYGAGRLADAGRAWGQGVWLALGLSVVGGAAMLFPGVWLSLSGDLDPEVVNGVTWYMRALILALPASLLFRTIYSLGAAVSRPKPVMLLNLGAVLVKLLLNWVFIFGKFGLPAMGAAGAGLSTAAVSWLSLGAGLYVMFRSPLFRRLSPQLGKPSLRDQKELLRLGLPMGASYLIEICAFSVMALLAAREGTYVSGGHQIMANLAALCYMMPMSIGIAAAALTAQAIGAGKQQQARMAGLAGLSLVLSGAVLSCIILIAGKPWILKLYTDDPQVALVAAALMQLIPLFHLCDALQCINSYLLRAYKVAVVPMLLQIVALLGFGLAGGWALGYGPAAGGLQPALDWIMPGAPSGIASMWLMASAGLALSAVLLNLWYWRVVRQYAALKLP